MSFFPIMQAEDLRPDGFLWSSSLCCPDILPSNIWCGWKERLRNKATYPIQYTIDKFKRLLPYTTVGFVADCIISAWKYQFTGMELVKWILYLPVNLFYLAGTGMMPADVPISDTVQTSYIMGGALWYICAMFVLCR